MKTRLSFNCGLVDKPSAEVMKSSSSLGWRAEEVDLDAFINHVSGGHAFAPQYKDEHRKGGNFVAAGFVAADFDEGVTLSDARNNAFINSYAAFIYTTASHTDEHHRFRVVFLVETTFDHAQDWADANLALAFKLGSDLSTSDKARCFFGNRAATFWKLGNVLPSEKVDDLIQSGRELRAARTGGFAVDSSKKAGSTTLLKLADGQMLPLSEINVGASVYCPNHDDRRPSAFIVKSWRDEGRGIHCRACRCTYWQADPDEYDFQAFDTMVDQRVARPLKVTEAKTFMEDFFPPEPDCFVSQDRFLAVIDYAPGVTLVKSPKGTGKTTVLKRLLRNIETGQFPPKVRKNERAKTVLLIGHRRALLREAAGKLDLPYYLEVGGARARNPDSLAVCLDSLPNYTEPYVSRMDGQRLLFKQDDAFDLVIIDESEQVLSHLIGGTIAKKQGALERCYDSLKYQIANAKSVVALDADLGMLTAHALRYFRPQDWQSRTRIIHNKPVPPKRRRTIHLYESEIALREELLRVIGLGERCFVTSNSKKAVKVIEKVIGQRLGNKVKMRTVTSENSRDNIEIEFVKNICDEMLKIQVLICSPSLGTGIDVTYPDPSGTLPEGLCKIDNVFGFFYPKVNTHTDMDQQLSRVRNPGSVKVWISPARSHFSSNFEVIRDDLARARYVPGAARGYDIDGLTLYDPLHPLLMIYTHVIAAQRASKNKLIELFCELRVAQGWQIDHVDTRVNKNRDRSQAERSLWNEHTKGLFEAPVLDDLDYLDLCIRRERGDPLDLRDRLSYERNTLERTLRVQLTYDIIKLNYDGGLPGKVEVLADVVRHWSGFQDAAQVILGLQAQPLARIPKLRAQLLLSLIALVAGIGDATGLLRDTKVTAQGLSAFADLCANNKTVLEDLLGRKVRDDVKSNPIRQLNAFLGLGGLKLEPATRQKTQKKSVRGYAFNPEKFDTMLSLAKAFRTEKKVKKDLEEARELLREAA